jgi:hypothetical protein
MNMLDLFFPMSPHKALFSEFGKYLKENSGSDEIRKSALQADITSQALKVRVDELEEDLGLALLLIGSLISGLDERGVMTRHELKTELEEMDVVDGVKDGKITSRLLRMYLGAKG